MEKELLDKYNPANAKNLTQEDLAAMKNFTKDEVKELAEAYPNSNIMKPYLVLRDTSKADNKQIWPLSTWKNFFELLKVGQKTWVVETFRSLHQPKRSGLKTAPVQDLTKDQAKAELKSATTQGAKASSAKELPKATEQEAIQTGSVSSKSAQQIADEEMNGIEGGNGQGNDQPGKPIDKMNVSELQAEYLRVTGEEASEEMKKADLVKALKERQ